MSELLDRIQREIRERLEATRAAVREHERLEAALHALGDAGARAARTVGSSGRGLRPAAAGKAKRTAGGASASARRSSGATAGVDRGRASAGGRAADAPAKRQRTAGAATAAPARGRAPRGANRAAVLRVIGERPGVGARELAAASQVTGGTLYSLLRRLADDGTVEKRELPGGRTRYALATSPAAEQSASAPPQSATTDGPGVQSPAAAGPEQDRAGSTHTADARSRANEAQASEASASESTGADEPVARHTDR